MPGWVLKALSTCQTHILWLSLQPTGTQNKLDPIPDYLAYKRHFLDHLAAVNCCRYLLLIIIPKQRIFWPISQHSSLIWVFCIGCWPKLSTCKWESGHIIFKWQFSTKFIKHPWTEKETQKIKGYHFIMSKDSGHFLGILSEFHWQRQTPRNVTQCIKVQDHVAVVTDGHTHCRLTVMDWKDTLLRQSEMGTSEIYSPWKYTHNTKNLDTSLE